jgi:hypothetical protein
VLGLGLNYQATGEFISQPYDFSQPVSRVMLDTQQSFMITSDVCQLRHFLSPDRGESWQELQPVEGLSAALPHLNNDPHFFSSRPVLSPRWCLIWGRERLSQTREMRD